jgi:hypothetical protein
MISSVGIMKFPIYGKIKNVPNHQPVLERLRKVELDAGSSIIPDDDVGSIETWEFQPGIGYSTRVFYFHHPKIRNIYLIKQKRVVRKCL